MIGAGILGLPYVTAQAGLLAGIGWICGLGLIFLLVNLCLGEVIERTKGHHHLVSLCAKYLGRPGQLVMGLSFVIGVYGALVAYTIGEGDVLSQMLGWNPLMASLGFFVVAMGFAVGGVQVFERFEEVFVILLLLVLAVIVVAGWPYVSTQNFSPTNNWLLPYGVVVFAYMSMTVLPDVKQISGRSFKKTIILGSLIPIGVYLLFSLVIVAITGAATTEVATIGVGDVLGSWGLVLLNGFAMLTMATSFVGLGFAQLEVFLEAGFSKLTGGLLTFAVPLGLFLAANEGFVKTLNIAGSLSGGLLGILVLVMFYRAKKEGSSSFTIPLPRLFGVLIGLLFFLGMLSVFW